MPIAELLGVVFPELSGVQVERVFASRPGFTVYVRRLTDLTVSGKETVVHLLGRRFFCGTDSCGRRTFVEQVAPSRLTVKHGRRRLSRPGTSEDRLALGGCAGACMTRHLVTVALGGDLQELPGGVDVADRADRVESDHRGQMECSRFFGHRFMPRSH